MSELESDLIGMNLAAAAAVVVVLALRLPARRAFGARIAYGLWSLAPLAGLAKLLPSRVVRVEAPALAPLDLAPSAAAAPHLAAQLPPAVDLWDLAGLAWFVGCLASLAWLAWRQHQFGRAVRDGRAGPAVIGVLRPRIVTPDDFDGLYTVREQQVVLAHEHTHIVRHDARVNALIALARCLLWFNPAVHVLAHYLRIDQELACDAQVVAAHPQARRAYAEAMLKTQLAARPLPLGCYWPAEGAHPLADRIRLLARPDPSRRRRLAGSAAVILLAAGAVGSAWAAKPAQVVTIAPSPAPVVAPQPAPTPRLAPARARADAPAPRPLLVKVAAPQPAPAALPAPEPEAAPLPAPAEADAPAPAPPAQAYARAAAARSASDWSHAASDRARASVRAAGMRPLIDPGTAVRVVAWTKAPDGPTLNNDITSYSSNPLYRSGSYQRHGSAYGLYTSVYQQGAKLWITATVMHDRQPVVSGTVGLSPGETGDITLANGQVVTVTATQRPETSDEAEVGARAAHSIVYAADSPAMADWRERMRTRRAVPYE